MGWITTTGAILVEVPGACIVMHFTLAGIFGFRLQLFLCLLPGKMPDLTGHRPTDGQSAESMESKARP